MKYPETDEYYEYAVPERTPFNITPRQLTGNMVTPPSDLIVETKDQKTEQEIKVYDEKLKCVTTALNSAPAVPRSPQIR